MRQLLASIFTLLLTASNRVGLDPQTKAEIDEFYFRPRRPAFAIACIAFRPVEVQSAVSEVPCASRV